MKHTHRGTCQICGALQAVNPKTGDIAKHGYTVPNGYFLGTCLGSGNSPLQKSRTLCDEIRATLRKQVKTCGITLKKLQGGTSHPNQVIAQRGPLGGAKYATNPSTGRSEPVMISWEDAADYEREIGMKKAILETERHILWCQSTEKEMGLRADQILGTDLIAVEHGEKKSWSRGDTIQIDGVTATLERPAMDVWGNRMIGWYVSSPSWGSKPYRITTRKLNELSMQNRPQESGEHA